MIPREEMRRSYDRSAPDYERQFAALQAPKYDAVLERFQPAADARVLDLGCGTGLLLPRLAHVVRPVVGLDLSLGMLARCPGDRAWRVQADLLRLPLGDACADVAFSITSLILAPRLMVAAFAEAARVLAPGGVLALTVLRHDAYADVEEDLYASGLRPLPRFECGQDVGWICLRRS